MGPAAAGAAAHVFVDHLDALVLSEVDRHHLGRVLRLRDGDLITAGDGGGRWRPCRFGPALRADGEIVTESRPTPMIAVGFAITKGDKPERVVQRLTEVGVDRILPFVAEHTVVRWDADRAQRHAERFAVVAREAAMQCRRAWLPDVGAVATFGDVAALAGAAMADRGGAAPSLDHPVVLVGPEGGWSDGERDGGLPTVSLGPHVLRADTAAVAAGVLLSALRVALVTPGGAIDTERGILGHTE